MPQQLKVLEEFNSYMSAVFPHGRPHPLQTQEIRRAFYAGAVALYGKIVMAGLSAGGEPQPSDLTMLADLDAELKQFNEDVKAGRA